MKDLIKDIQIPHMVPRRETETVIKDLRLRLWYWVLFLLFYAVFGM